MNNAKTHMGWTIALLAAALIGSLSVSWATLEQIPNIISIALGLSSLVLAMVAIMQAVSGGSNLQRSLGKIESAAEKALSATDSVKRAADDLTERSNQIDKIFPSIKELGSKIDSIQESVTPAITADSGSTPNNQEDNDVDKMLNKGTIGTNVALYMALKSLETGKSFESAEVINDSPFVAGLVNGTLVSLRMTGNIDTEYVNGKIKILDLKEFTKAKINERLNSEHNRDFYHDYIDQIDNFFK